MLTFRLALVPRQHRVLALTFLCLLLSASLEAHSRYLYPELASESLCWLILYVVTPLSSCQRHHRKHGERPPEQDGEVAAENDNTVKLLVASSEDGQATVKKTTEAELLIAGAIVISSTCRQLTEVNWTLPFVAFLLDCCRTSSSTSWLQCPTPEWRINQWKSTLTALAIAFLSSAALVPVPLSIHSVALAGCFMLCQWTLYNGVSRMWNEGAFRPSVQEKTMGVLHSARSIAGWALVCSLFLNVLFPMPLNIRFFLGGLLKVAWWATICNLLMLDTPVSVPVKISTFGTAMTYVYKVQQPLRALAAALAAACSLILLFPISRKGLLNPGNPWALGLSLLFLLGLLFYAQVLKSPGGSWSSPSLFPFSTRLEHPIESLIVKGKARHAAILRSQSQTLEDAVKEYRRRYGRPPPRGFDSWFHIAKSQGLVIIDDYDTVMRSLETYWRFSPSTLRRNVEAAATHLHLANDLMVRSRNMSTTREPEFFLFSELVKETAPYVEILPDLPVPVLFNRLDDIDLARIVLPHDAVGSARKVEYCSEPEDFQWLDLYGQYTWDTLILSCPPESAARQDQKQINPAKGLPFLGNVPDSSNVCLHPDLRHKHGAWTPSRRHYISHIPIPIFSSSKLSLNNDILFPSPYYANDFRRKGANESKAWEEKSNDLYWAGSTTGFHVFQNSKWPWRNITSHRHRFVEFVNDMGPPRNVTLLQATRNGRWLPYETSMASQIQLYDVSFSTLSQCDDERQCPEMKAYFNITGGHSSEEHKNHRFVFDLDGNAFSGRFYRLLEANATVLKQTIFQEWHDDSLIPWYHYVPVSMGMEELPEIMHYLAGTEKGQQRAREIAHQAAEWAKVALRREDTGAIFVRLLLEYARLVDDERDSMGCC